MVVLKILCVIAGTILAAAVMENLEWLFTRPISEEQSTPIYITKRLDF